MANDNNKINISGTFKNLAGFNINISSTFKEADSASINIGGTFKEFWAALGDRGVFIGGENTVYDVMDYITILSPGVCTDFGNLTAPRTRIGATSNGNSGRGVLAGGFEAATVDTIEYITILSPGASTDFSNLLTATLASFLGACSNGTNDRAVFTHSTGATDNVLQYITILSPSNAVDFGDLFEGRGYVVACSNGTDNRGVFSAGYGTDFVDSMDYISINSAGNADDFGNLTVPRYALGAASNGTNNRGCWGGGAGTIGGVQSTIDFVTISSTSNAAPFGNLTEKRQQFSATSNAINNRGVWGGGKNDSAVIVNTIDYISINSEGNADDFGDLTQTRRSTGACSN